MQQPKIVAVFIVKNSVQWIWMNLIINVQRTKVELLYIARKLNGSLELIELLDSVRAVVIVNQNYFIRIKIQPSAPLPNENVSEEKYQDTLNDP